MTHTHTKKSEPLAAIRDEIYYDVRDQRRRWLVELLSRHTADRLVGEQLQQKHGPIPGPTYTEELRYWNRLLAELERAIPEASHTDATANHLAQRIRGAWEQIARIAHPLP